MLAFIFIHIINMRFLIRSTDDWLTDWGRSENRTRFIKQEGPACYRLKQHIRTQVDPLEVQPLTLLQLPAATQTDIVTYYLSSIVLKKRNSNRGKDASVNHRHPSFPISL
jgi:hypothetical protein